MILRVYLHRTKKHEFEVADAFEVKVDLENLPDDKKEDLDYINLGFKNDCQKLARTRECVQKYGTAYVSFMRPQFEGDEKDNGNDKVYFDNKEMLFMKRKPKRTRKKKVEEPVDEQEKK